MHARQAVFQEGFQTPEDRGEGVPNDWISGARKRPTLSRAPAPVLPSLPPRCQEDLAEGFAFSAPFIGPLDKKARAFNYSTFGLWPTSVDKRDGGNSTPFWGGNPSHLCPQPPGLCRDDGGAGAGGGVPRPLRAHLPLEVGAIQLPLRRWGAAGDGLPRQGTDCGVAMLSLSRPLLPLRRPRRASCVPRVGAWVGVARGRSVVGAAGFCGGGPQDQSPNPAGLTHWSRAGWSSLRGPSGGTWCALSGRAAAARRAAPHCSPKRGGVSTSPPRPAPRLPLRRRSAAARACCQRRLVPPPRTTPPQGYLRAPLVPIAPTGKLVELPPQTSSLTFDQQASRVLQEVTGTTQARSQHKPAQN